MIATRPSHITTANKRLERQAAQEQRVYDVMGRWAWFCLGCCAATFVLILTASLGEAYATGGWHGETYQAPPCAGHVL